MDLAAEIDEAFRAFARRDYAAAAERARGVLRHSPHDPAALTLFGRLALVSQQPDVARQIFTDLLRTPAQRGATWLDLSQAWLDLRREPEAIDAAERALAMDKNSVPALLKLGGIWLSLGEHSKARDAFRRAIVVDATCTNAFRGLCEADELTPDSNTVAQMERLAKAPATSAREAAELHYALAQLYRRAGRADAFIQHLFAANDRQRAATTGDRAQYEESFDRLDATFTADALRTAARAAPTVPTPIFILGMPRSGTTLVEQLVAAHPDVAAGGELDYMRGPLRHSLERETRQPFPLGFDRLSEPSMTALAAAYARRLGLIAAGRACVTDKTPGNFHLLGLLRILFPRSRIIHVAREPMDTCFSILQYPFDDRSPHTCDIGLLAYSYARYLRLMRRWEELFGGEFITVQYEQLVESPAAQARRIFNFCGLEWRDSYLEPQGARSAVHTFSAMQVRRPIYKSSVGAWRRYADALQPLREALAVELHGSAHARDPDPH